MTGEKLLAQLNMRLADSTLAEIDSFIAEREEETRVPHSRAVAVRLILEAWADQRRASRDQDVPGEDPRARA